MAAHRTKGRAIDGHAILRRSFGHRTRRRLVPTDGAGHPLLTFSTIDQWGSKATLYAEPATDYPLDPYDVQCAGFNGIGAPITFVERRFAGSKARRGFISGDTYRPVSWSAGPPLGFLTDTVWAHDTVLGGTVANDNANSAPKPLFQWRCFSHLVVGNSITLRAFAAQMHGRDGRGSVLPSATGVANYIDPRFVDRKAVNANDNAVGGGNYDLLPDTPVPQVPILLMPWDANGEARTPGTRNRAGAYRGQLAA